MDTIAAASRLHSWTRILLLGLCLKNAVKLCCYNAAASDNLIVRHNVPSVTRQSLLEDQSWARNGTPEALPRRLEINSYLNLVRNGMGWCLKRIHTFYLIFYTLSHFIFWGQMTFGANWVVTLGIEFQNVNLKMGWFTNQIQIIICSKDSI
jgi:hypothetical protein